MKLYIVVRSGVYLQGIYGIYDSIEKAKTAKVNAKSKENDNYHDFEIYETILDKDGYVIEDDIS